MSNVKELRTIVVSQIVYDNDTVEQPSFYVQTQHELSNEQAITLLGLGMQAVYQAMALDQAKANNERAAQRQLQDAVVAPPEVTSSDDHEGEDGSQD